MENAKATFSNYASKAEISEVENQIWEAHEEIAQLTNRIDEISKCNNKSQLYTALANAQAEFPFIEKNKDANYGKYADKFAMMQPIWIILKQHGLAIRENIKVLEDGTEILQVILSHSSGQFEVTQTKLTAWVRSANENPDHAWAKTVTYKSRSLYRGILGIAIPHDTEDIDDVDLEEQKKNKYKPFLAVEELPAKTTKKPSSKDNETTKIEEKPATITVPGKVEFITADQEAELERSLMGQKDIMDSILKGFKITSSRSIPKDLFRDTMDRVDVLKENKKSIR